MLCETSKCTATTACALPGTAAETTSTLLLEPAFFAGAPLFGTSSGGGGTGGRDTFSGGGAAQLIIDPTQVRLVWEEVWKCGVRPGRRGGHWEQGHVQWRGCGAADSRPNPGEGARTSVGAVWGSVGGVWGEVKQEEEALVAKTRSVEGALRS